MRYRARTSEREVVVPSFSEDAVLARDIVFVGGPESGRRREVEGKERRVRGPGHSSQAFSGDDQGPRYTNERAVTKQQRQEKDK